MFINFGRKAFSNLEMVNGIEKKVLGFWQNIMNLENVHRFLKNHKIEKRIVDSPKVH